ncbi:hypothetical protein PGT21_025379 [Puccinia graminis f. sp. tritici]|uniref:Prefoldin subunit 1 n=2 Tax=Puccinia graminis f. sp. tritici TaxID=56615 RepID=E3JR67_PUCGT|nr:uncharacterized protein PGTG_00689 [Puccinia graminis f. sp. tritici CRL 75-36-700-3]KAA1105891.1 hypothetical protein PGT21_023355 [Puccinia graminis f. sp. tritici]EFP74733.2 hypothetical protein PGTG_00689 [Puccinia graminis f. sp. tritici CRL 75-36-700-3]KAA1114853.1 hypothetical protein PGT21_025379 [Puccinia graminis f. sp. tritici]KAA1121034.1 hypothetical protein PGTUg99_028216 [Puccinia graminis f. sp. tritici]KAA1127033.1 hypothetical protein PGTUg99_010457 [Puccinia graminis f. s
MSNDQQNDEIRNILGQLQRQARDVTRELTRCRAELGHKVRVARQSSLTLTELNKLATGDIRFYQPVGKMFMLKSRTSIDDGLKTKQKSAEDDVNKLITRIKSLEAEVEANQRALKEIVRSIDMESRPV